ncbi:hypothetical protein [Methanosarcina mazei]|uniref:Uncharacterized protein n=1 Tax=Methanosarcina mazei TaxID=2209 RepID=A0A0F8S1Q4_METMZ|nr:hypothetical protein [Methanosarcina mazei]KKG02383.1 hypothetical protein DU47_12335 [Methanosarcina mazei]KKG06591.1 hypothetical protein DU31_14760 [Methanosarcina mazei]KKG09497.1 hypothetical protein DU34_15715 [Methanosarcina mazei]KKG27836.1 hypothetical protein DU49_14935 [Methanosarcina mazei]KKG37517.1 hypothetical protein DU30_14515 [Methanosarcina mazei]
MWGIIYSEIDQLLDARNDKEKQFIIAKSVVKKALLGFYYDWKTRGEYDGYSIFEEMFRRHARIFIEVAVEVRDILPERVADDLLSIISNMKTLAGEPIHTADVERYKKLSDECMSDVLNMYENFEKYFD